MSKNSYIIKNTDAIIKIAYFTSILNKDIIFTGFRFSIRIKGGKEWKRRLAEPVRLRLRSRNSSKADNPQASSLVCICKL